jgi:hypothetical protein
MGMKIRLVGLISLLVMPACATDDEKAQDGPLGAGDQDAGDIVVDARPRDATDAPDVLMCPQGIGYFTPGCGSAVPAPRCTGDTDVGCAQVFCGCDGVTFEGGCGFSHKPYANAGPCEDATTLVDAKADALVCSGRLETVAYNKPGCGSAAPAAYCQGDTDACAQVFCGCDGLTFWGGCGFSPKPFAHWGACPDGGPADGGGD